MRSLLLDRARPLRKETLSLFMQLALCETPARNPGQQPFSYKAGVGQVITGWDQGLLGMQIGEERKVVIPGHEGYGAQGFPAWGITPNATLEFTLERLK